MNRKVQVDRKMKDGWMENTEVGLVSDLYRALN